jgi:hypothetical protein
MLVVLMIFLINNDDTACSDYRILYKIFIVHMSVIMLISNEHIILDTIGNQVKVLCQVLVFVVFVQIDKHLMKMYTQHI